MDLCLAGQTGMGQGREIGKSCGSIPEIPCRNFPDDERMNASKSIFQ